MKRDYEKWLAWQRRSKPLSRSAKRLERSPIRPVGRRKKRMQNSGQVDGVLCDEVRRLPCCVCGSPPPNVPHHVSGGTLRADYLPDGTPNVAPLCEHHHTGKAGVHTIGKETFAERFELNLASVAADIGRET